MKVVVFGAGSIGVYVGCSLLASGADVGLVGRAKMRERIDRDGVLLTDLHGGRTVLDAASVPLTDDAAILGGAGLILVTVKSTDTGTAAEAIRTHARPDALVLSLQNGIGNTGVLRDKLGTGRVLGGIVPFNVVQMGRGRFHRGTEGRLIVEASPALAPWLSVFGAAGLPLEERGDFAAVQWGKLLLNLNNPVNALSGLPLKEQLSRRDYRYCVALLVEEALSVLDAAGIRPARVTRLPPARLPFLLRLPDWLFTRLAAAMLRMDPEARSSTWEDLQAGRRTEIDFLNGAVVQLAASVGMQTPANRKVVELIRRAEAGERGVFDGATLFDLLRTSTFAA